MDEAYSVSLTLKEVDRIIEKLRLDPYSSADLHLIRRLESIKEGSIHLVEYNTPADENWYFRNRSRDAVVDMFRVIRQLQLLNGFKSSDIMKAMLTVWRELASDDFIHLYLAYIIRELLRDERNRHGKRR